MKYLLPILSILMMGCNSAIIYPEGGYPYPKQIAPLDLNQYHYPIKDVVSKRDSLPESYSYIFFRAFDEPNISLKPQPTETFRLTFSAPLDKQTIITIAEDGITIKKGRAGNKYGYFDDSQLSEIENSHLSLLRKHFPIDTLGKDSNRIVLLRSALKEYPQLLDPFYYKMLYEKALSSNELKYPNEHYTYKQSKISISRKKFENWVKELNESEFWQSPLEIVDAGDIPMDNPHYFLEANTTKKYNSVGKSAYANDETKFAKACQSLINLAGLGNEIHIAENGEERDED